MEREHESRREFATDPAPVEHATSAPADVGVQRTVQAPSAISIGNSIAQAKLSVGPADDPYEREADQVAARVVRALRSGVVEPAADTDATTSDGGRVRRSAVASPSGVAAASISRIQRAPLIGAAGGEIDDDTSKLLRSTRSGGRPMDGASRTRMEGAFGADFSRVRVHSNAVSTELNNRIQAKAFTTGNDIYFRDGLPDTSSSGGQELLAHELTHTLQQSGGPQRMRRVIDVAALRQSAKDANGTFGRFKKSSMETVFKAADAYNAAPTPLELAKVKYQIDCLKQEKFDKYQATAQQLETNMAADLVALIGQPANWASSAASLRDPSWSEELEGLFELCSSGLIRGKLLYRLGGDVAWKENAMTQFTISQNDFREALANLGVFEDGTAGHKGAAEVDGLIAEKLASFVQNNLQNRGRIEGRLAVVGAADWEVIGRQQYGEDVWNGGKRRTLNAFVDRSSDPPRVFVNKDRGNAGTAIHEACHMWGDAARPINRISHNLNEGITEYFARKICSSLTPPIARTVYAKQFNIANKLVQTIGEDVVGAAFFDGLVGGMSAAFGATRWANFITHVNAGDYARAETVLEKVARQADDEVDEAEVGASIAEMFSADA